MADPKHLELLQQGVDAWNAWRAKEPSVKPDLRAADLRGAILKGANLGEADLSGAILEETNLWEVRAHRAKFMRANLRSATLTGADLSGANLRRANLRKADLGAVLDESSLVNGANLCLSNLSGADLSGANCLMSNFNMADLSSAKLRGTNLEGATLIEADLTNANVTGCRVYGISAWRLKLNAGTKQQNLVITGTREPEVVADDIEVAQFLHLMLHNEKIRNIIDTITSKVVLILGRFTPERKALLDAMRDELRNRGYVPVVFDFEKPQNQTTAETVGLLARMARFVIADLSDAKSVLQELRDIVPNNPMLAVQPLIIAAQDEPGMFDFFKKFQWVLKTYRYDNLAQLTADLDEWVIRPAEAKVLELRGPQP